LANPLSLLDAVSVQGKFSRRQNFEVLDFPCGRESGFAIPAQALNFFLLWKLVGSLKFAGVMWVGIRIFSVWVNMIQTIGPTLEHLDYRRLYDEEDNAMNIGEWLPVTGDFQRVPAKQSSSLTKGFAAKPRQIRIRLWIYYGESDETSGPGEGDEHGRAVTKDVPLDALGF